MPLDSHRPSGPRSGLAPGVGSARLGSAPAPGPDSQPGAALLVARSLGVVLAGSRVLDALDLTLFAAEPLLVQGPSGCGKTTLLRTLAWLQPATMGRVELVGGPDPVLHAPAYRHRVVYVGQQPALHPISVRANLERPFAFAAARPAPFDLSTAAELLAALGLPDVLDRDARELSVGQQQRVCLARALLVQPTVLLLDEPTSALDDAAAAQLSAVVAGWLEAGGARGLAVATHAAGRLARLCRHELCMRPPAGRSDG